MYILIHDNTASPASNNVHGRENGFDITKLIHQNMSSAVVKWSRSCLQRADDPGSAPGDAVFCFFVPFFFLVFNPIFNPIFPFGLFSSIDTAYPADHALGSIYVSLKFYFGKCISRALDLHTGQAYGQKKT